MTKFALDFEQLEKKIAAKKAYKLEDVQGKIKKIAFDVVRFIDSDNIDNLWRIEHGPEGDYIVAMYDEETSELEKKASLNWEVILDNSNKNVSVFYKATPIVRLATDKLGLDSDSVKELPYFLPAKLASNQELVKSLLNEVEIRQRHELYNQYPELRGTQK